MEYTYYGDLLAISGQYHLTPDTAYNRLNDFYNTTFSSLKDYCENRTDVNVNMFSDSLLIWGEDAEGMLIELQKVYTYLIDQGLMLRGAMVDGKLQFDPRRTIDNIRKELPTSDILARALGLEKSQKGARLLIENKLAEKLLDQNREWLTHEGYIRRIQSDFNIDSILRRISPTPDNKTYELLYFWVCPDDAWRVELDYDRKRSEFKEISKMLERKFSVQYDETIKLLDRCKARERLTMRGPRPSRS